MMWNGAIYVIIKTCREHAVERKNGAIYVIKTCGEHHTRCGKEKRSHLCIKTCREHHTRCGKEKRSHLCHQNMRGASYTLWKGKTEPYMASKHAGSIIHAVERKNEAIYDIKSCGEHHTRCGKEKRIHLCHQNMRGASYTLWKGIAKPSMSSKHAGSIIHAVEGKKGPSMSLKHAGSIVHAVERKN